MKCKHCGSLTHEEFGFRPGSKCGTNRDPAISDLTKRIRAQQAGPTLTIDELIEKLRSGEAYIVHCPSLSGGA